MRCCPNRAQTSAMINNLMEVTVSGEGREKGGMLCIAEVIDECFSAMLLDAEVTIISLPRSFCV